MKNLPTKHEAQAGKRGFTLTEIAIVLGIIGLILGAIWVAAAAVYTNLRVSKATTELLQVTQAVRAMYATSTTVDPAADMTMTGAQAANALTYIRSGIFPTDALDSQPATATQARGPWGGNIAIRSATSTGGTANDSFVVAFNAIPTNACISMLTSNTGTGRDSGMWGYAAGAANTTPPVTGTAVPATGVLASTARGLCTAAAGNADYVGFYFSLRGGT